MNQFDPSDLSLRPNVGGFPLHPTDRLDPAHAGGHCQLDGASRDETILQIDWDTLKRVPEVSRTIIFDMKEVAAAPGNSDHRPQARIYWASAKGKNVAAIDLVKGAAIAIEGAMSVTVSASMGGYNIDDEFSWSNALLPTAAPTYDVFCSIGRSGQGRIIPNTFTAPLETIAAAAVARLIIPKYARLVELKHSGNPFAAIPQDVLIGFGQWNAAGVPARTQTGLRDTPLAIPTGSEVLLLTNLSGANVNVQPVYHLAV